MQQSSALQELANTIIREQEYLAGMRGTWESVWEQIARRIFPHYAGQFTGQNRYSLTPGIQNTEEMIDSTGVNALIRFAAAMESMLTPRNSIWHRLAPSDRNLRKSRWVREWFDNTTDRLFQYRYAPSANFASQKHEEYMALGSFGTGCTFIDKLASKRERGLRYRGIHLGQVYFKENHQGIVDTVYRRFSFTARQAVQRFKNLPDSIHSDAKSPTKCETPHYFIHCVNPRDEAVYDPGRLDHNGMPISDVYVSLTEKMVIEQGGFHTFPYTISRYVTAPNETYGRSPAMMALPALKTLNEEKKTILKQGHRIVDPVLLAHDDGVVDDVSLVSGAVIPGGVNADGRLLVQPLPTGNLAVGHEMMNMERESINDSFLITLFQILVDTPTMTATEVIERAREKGALLSPTMGRQQSESQGPGVARELDLLSQLGVLDPMPQELIEARGEYQVEYDSPLSRMAKAGESAGLMRVVDYMKEVVAVTQDPEPLDWINWDEAMPGLMDQQSVPASWQRDRSGVDARREKRSKQAESQQAIQAAPAAANMAKTVAGMATGG